MVNEKAARFSQPLLAGLVVVVLLMMVLPLPPALLDLLLAINISLSLFILLLTMEVSSPLELSVFPSLLLLATLSAWP